MVVTTILTRGGMVTNEQDHPIMPMLLKKIKHIHYEPSFSFRLNRMVVLPAASRPTMMSLDSCDENIRERRSSHERSEMLWPMMNVSLPRLIYWTCIQQYRTTRRDMISPYNLCSRNVLWHLHLREQCFFQNKLCSSNGRWNMQEARTIRVMHCMFLERSMGTYKKHGPFESCIAFTASKYLHFVTTTRKRFIFQSDTTESLSFSSCSISSSCMVHIQCCVYLELFDSIW